MVAIAILPEVPVDHKPVGIKVICPPPTNSAGTVIVLMVVVPDTKVIGASG